MEQWFVTGSAKPVERWLEAFPGAAVVSSVSAVPPGDTGILWLDYSSFGPEAAAESLRQAVALGCPVVVLSAVPDDQEAFAVLAAGSRGYCHSMSAPRLLVEVADVVARGGLWLSPELMKRLVSLSVRVSHTDEALQSLEKLTERERAVAEKVAEGATNAEIAQALNIAERTVKAHLSSVFDKLEVRDRVHLALVVSGHLSS